jgi:hypothetical protein
VQFPGAVDEERARAKLLKSSGLLKIVAPLLEKSPFTHEEK